MTPKQESEFENKIFLLSLPPCEDPTNPTTKEAQAWAKCDYIKAGYRSKQALLKLANDIDDLQSKLEQQRKLLEEAEKVIKAAREIFGPNGVDNPWQHESVCELRQAFETYDNLKKGQE